MDSMDQGDLRTSQLAQQKLVYLRQGSGVLPVVLNDIHVIGGGKKAGEG
jgi:hypothetical protein